MASVEPVIKAARAAVGDIRSESLSEVLFLHINLKNNDISSLFILTYRYRVTVLFIKNAYRMF